ncbi:MAG: DUF2911 domain-containing protein [Salibacteraceae bacterium]
MKRLFLSLFIASASIMVADAQEKPKSPAQSTSATIDGVNVTITYNAPSVRGREIWGKLVPFNEVWRTGANEATTISFDKDVMIEGQALPSGSYALFTIPGEDEWTYIFNSEPKQWGAYKYDQSKDALRVKATPKTRAMQEQMAFVIEDNKVMLHWEKLGVHFSVKGM